MNQNFNNIISKKYIERIVNIRRVSKVVKGGRRFSFSALIVVGDGINQIGFGIGKAKEVPDAIKKGKDKALKNMIIISKNTHTIPHKIIGKSGSGLVVMLPASKGTGIIAGSAMRYVFECIGIENILSKSIKSKNCSNIVRATVNGLKKLILYSEKKIHLTQYIIKKNI